jgi:hypothetical protein
MVNVQQHVLVSGGCGLVALAVGAQGHNCFGAVLHPITMADFLVAGLIRTAG